MNDNLTIETMGHGEDKLKDLGEGKKVLDVLEKHYPGHDWFINCSHFAGTISVQIMYEKDGKTRIWKYGYILHINKLLQMSASEYEHKVMQAGGEVLERYGMARSAVSEKSIVDMFSRNIDTAGMVA